MASEVEGRATPVQDGRAHHAETLAPPASVAPPGTTHGDRVRVDRSAEIMVRGDYGAAKVVLDDGLVLYLEADDVEWLICGLLHIVFPALREVRP